MLHWLLPLRRKEYAWDSYRRRGLQAPRAAGVPTELGGGAGGN